MLIGTLATAFTFKNSNGINNSSVPKRTAYQSLATNCPVISSNTLFQTGGTEALTAAFIINMDMGFIYSTNGSQVNHKTLGYNVRAVRRVKIPI